MRMIAALAHRGPDGAGIFEADPETRAGTCPAGDSRPLAGRRAAHDLARRALDDRVQRRDFQLSRAARRTRRGSPGAPRATRKCCSKPARPGESSGRSTRSIGMFAFALWDARERELTLARDRVGEKPLVYFEDGQHVGFCQRSEGAPGFSWRASGPGRRWTSIWRWVTFRLRWRFSGTSGNFRRGTGCGGKTGRARSSGGGSRSGLARRSRARRPDGGKKRAA